MTRWKFYMKKRKGKWTLDIYCPMLEIYVMPGNQCSHSPKKTFKYIPKIKTFVMKHYAKVEGGRRRVYGFRAWWYVKNKAGYFTIFFRN
jgi:hypothetical protein